MDRKFKIAHDKANLINMFLDKKYGHTRDPFTSLDLIVDAVKENAKYEEIVVVKQSFSSILDTKFHKCGAMLSTTEKDNKKDALLIVNSDLSANMQRFSVAHELGHLITEIPNYEVPNDGKSTVSTHINSDITYISEKDCDGNDYLLAEQVANIFALCVLIPENLKIKDFVDNGVDNLSKKYGVTEDAIYSRLLISSANFD